MNFCGSWGMWSNRSTITIIKNTVKTTAFHRIPKDQQTKCWKPNLSPKKIDNFPNENGKLIYFTITTSN